MTDVSRREAKRAVKDQQRAAEQWATSPQGQARDAWQAGEVFFQLVLPVVQRRQSGALINQNGAFSPATVRSSAQDLAAVEAEGWQLDNVGYVFEQTGQISRDKFLSSGQQTATSGRVLGVYLFRRRRPGEQQLG